MGIKELTEADIKKIEALTEKINKLEEVEDAYIENPNEATETAFAKASMEAQDAKLEIHNLTASKSDIVRTIKSIITGSFMGVPSLIKNIWQSVTYESTIRFPQLVVLQTLDGMRYAANYALYKLGKGEVPKLQYNIAKAQVGAFKNLAKGSKVSFYNLRKGIIQQDVTSKTEYQSTLAPRQAIKELKLWKAGELFLTNKEVLDRRLRASLIARQSDFILRSMGAGDLPMRWLAQGAKAIQIASSEFGLTKDHEINAFTTSPRKYAYKEYIKQGKSAEEANKLATEIENTIIKKGEMAVFQQENVLSKGAEKLEDALKTKEDNSFGKRAFKNVASIAKSTYFPFIKTPANVYWTYFKANNPLVCLAQASWQSAEAYKLRKSGDFAGANKIMENAKENVSLAVVGFGMQMAVQALIGQGLVRTSNTEDEKSREREGERAFGKQNQLNLGQLMGGDDYWVDLSWLGILGTQIDVQARLHEDNLDKKAKGEETAMVDDFFDNIKYSAAASLNSLVFDQGARILNTLQSGDKNAAKKSNC